MQRWQAPRSTISDVFRMFCRRTNGHGWRRIVRAPTLRGTTVWFALTYLFFGGGLIYTFVRWSDYINYETGACTSAERGNERATT